MAAGGSQDIPTWNGDAATFETFATACKWYQRSLKDSEQKLAASKVWQRLSSAAKQVVKHRPPEELEDETGLEKLLDVLRASPLQLLPVPDSLSRLEAWHHLRRAPHETIPELLVREEDLFIQLQMALERARAAKTGSRVSISGGILGQAFLGRTGTTPVDPPSTPSRSPVSGGNRRTGTGESPAAVEQTPLASFFEDELRGYRLLKAARLSTSEKQRVLTQTANSTHYHQIRLALRTLFADDGEAHAGFERRKTAWVLEETWDDYPVDEGWEELDWADGQDWSPSGWDEWVEPNFWQDWSGDA